ncbi:aspartic peptidase domain-containing protein [Neohortaea acidophila]|uniref:Probable aspartic-type endopeptidase OPSB n=1 Tax=Neohortaea acidophila TaxID=245834 RepID=A0A6A6PGL5_9PEZI|nr:aspartic peptidase domain-containing protein [Neohortaea acidophila]KAF2478926.1 aspartic peptidase domain-containing protein [Neohortaea acidophila]
MRTSSATLALASYLLASADAINLLQRRDGVPPSVVHHKIQRRHVENPIAHDRARRMRRSDTVQVSLANEETLYFMDVSIGTPAQAMKLHIDTGSSDLWTNVANSAYCESSANTCLGGTYNANDSSTYKYLNSDFNITYVDGSGAVGDYVEDTVQFSGVTLKEQVFGIGYQSSSQEGLIGIGYPSNEAAVSYGFKPYANVPVSLVNQGYIKTNAYSLWLDDLESSTGSILFGGVDTARYTGKLETLPIVKTDGVVYADFIIALTEVGYGGNQGSIATNLNVGAILDSGSSLMYLPDQVAQKIFDQVGAQYNSRTGAAVVDCNVANSDDTIDFTFSSPTISVALSEIILEVGQNQCILGIGLAGDSTPVLGDTFLRSAYVVYDISSNEISIAQTDFSGKSSNVLEITGNSIPSATSVSNAVTSVVQASGAVNVGFSSTAASSHGAAPTAPVGYNLALLGAAGAAIFAL